jgi:hypothetical protein
MLERIPHRPLAVAVSVLFALLPVLRARAEDATAMQDVLSILRKEGMIDEAGEQKVLAKYAVEQKAKIPAWLDGLDFNADLRLRYEAFLFDEDQRGLEQDNRYRFRYRARFGFTKKLNSVAKVGFRLATGFGTGDPRGTNVSFGEGNNDEFSPDGIFFDRAFLELNLQDGERMKTQLVAGKLANPFLGKVGSDLLLFDSDLNLEGAHLTSSIRLDERTRLYGTVGGFIVDEVAADKDPKLVGGQVSIETKLTDGLSVGLRASTYQFRSLDTDFIGVDSAAVNPNAAGAMSAVGNGNLPSAFDGEKSRFGETFAYVQMALADGWPLTVYGTLVKNFTADSEVLPVFLDSGSNTVVDAVEVDAEDLAYGFGFEVGDPVRFVKFTLGYFHVEANSVPGQFFDSDIFDGISNRRGYLFAAMRKVNPSTELRFAFFDGKEIEDAGGANGPFSRSLANADRQRLQADVIFGF